MRHFILLTITALILSACANAAVYTPQVGQDEISAEQGYQKDYVKSVNKAKLDAPLSADTQERVAVIFARIEKAGGDICSYLANGQPCNYPFKLITEPAKEAATPNAYADGNGVFVYAGLVNMLDGEEELAFVLSHEYAHNVLQHVNKQSLNMSIGMLAGAAADALLASQGYSTGGQFTKVGANAGALQYSSSYEREADYVGLYIVSRAGFDVSRGTEVWRKMAANNPDSIYLSSTHPNTAERYVAMQKTIQEILNKEATGQQLLPNKVVAE